MKHIIKVEVLENLPETRPLIAMDKNKKFFQEGKKKVPNDEIWYTSSDGKIVTPYKASSLPKIISNTYTDGKGIIKFETDVTWKGDDAFYNCTKLTSIEIPNSVTSIGNATFNGCSSLTSVTIPNSVTSIGSNTFNACTKLTSIEIPNSVTSIEMYAFASCSNLSSITIPNSVTSIGSGAFLKCAGLTSIIVENGNSMYDSRNNCNALIETKTNTLITGCQNTIIPNSITSIGSSAFLSCAGLTGIIIPNSVTSIGNNAFSGCTGLTSVIIPNSVTSIGNWAFSGCSGLTAINVAEDNPNYCSEDGVLFNKDMTALVLCPGGKQDVYTIPNSVTHIGDYAFRGCTGLTSAIIPNSVTSIGNEAFRNCTGLASIVIPNSVTNIGSSTFGQISAKILFSKLYSTYTNKIFTTPSANGESYTFNVEFNISEIPTNYNISSMLPKISDGGKGTITYNIYTDYVPCKDQVLAALATTKTIVNVYHIDGTPWE